MPDWPEMMSRSTAARYLDMTAPDFEREVATGRLPMPITLGGRDHWRRSEINDRLSELSGKPKVKHWRDEQLAYATR